MSDEVMLPRHISGDRANAQSPLALHRPPTSAGERISKGLARASHPVVEKTITPEFLICSLCAFLPTKGTRGGPGLCQGGRSRRNGAAQRPAEAGPRTQGPRWHGDSKRSPADTTGMAVRNPRPPPRCCRAGLPATKALQHRIGTRKPPSVTRTEKAHPGPRPLWKPAVSPA